MLTFRRVAFLLTIVALTYGIALLVEAYTYRKAYGIVDKPELAIRFMAKSLAGRPQNGF